MNVNERLTAEDSAILHRNSERRIVPFGRAISDHRAEVEVAAEFRRRASYLPIVYRIALEPRPTRKR